MKTITLVRRAIALEPNEPQSSVVELEITAANDTVTELFVKQRRITSGLPSFEDVFVAVASPAQIEEFPANVPDTTNFFRTDKITLVAENEALLDELVDTVVEELSVLLNNLTAQESLTNSVTYTITPSSVTYV
jgi:hypothetical protein